MTVLPYCLTASGGCSGAGEFGWQEAALAAANQKMDQTGAVGGGEASQLAALLEQNAAESGGSTSGDWLLVFGGEGLDRMFMQDIQFNDLQVCPSVSLFLCLRPLPTVTQLL